MSRPQKSTLPSSTVSFAFDQDPRDGKRKRAKRVTVLRVFLFCVVLPRACYWLRCSLRSSSAICWKLRTRAAFDGGSKYFSELDAHDLISARCVALGTL